MHSALVAVDLAPPPPSSVPPPAPSKPPPPRPAEASAPKGDPGVRAFKARPTPVFAPKVQPVLIVPPSIVAVPLPDLGAEASTGASNLPGPGQGAGAHGSGRGGGGTGGEGSGAGAPVKGPRQIRGHLSYDDLPAGLLADGQQAAVGVRYTVEADGTVSHCRIDQSSGFAALDAKACRLIEQRFRFRPARDRKGRPVSATIVEEHMWIARRD